MREQLLQRLQLLDQVLVQRQKEYKDAEANLNAVFGAKQELMHVLQLLEQSTEHAAATAAQASADAGIEKSCEPESPESACNECEPAQEECSAANGN